MKQLQELEGGQCGSGDTKPFSFVIEPPLQPHGLLLFNIVVTQNLFEACSAYLFIDDK